MPQSEFFSLELHTDLPQWIVDAWLGLLVVVANLTGRRVISLPVATIATNNGPELPQEADNGKQ